MGIISNICKKTLSYKTYDLIYSINQYIKDYNIVAESLYSDAFLTVLKRYLNKEFKKDWIGRLYAVINPNIDINGNLNFSNTIIELDDERTNNEKYVQNWLYRQMQLIADVFKIQNMYSYISMGIEHVGPKNADNYLVIFDITSRIEMGKAFKRFIKHLLAYIILGIGIFSLFKYILI